MIPVPSNQTTIIAEVGSNHVGDPGLAIEGIYAAKEAGADVVKFQMYSAEQLVDDKMPVLGYIQQSHATQRERFKSLQLSIDTFYDLAEKADKAGIAFMVTPFYLDAVKILDPLMPAFKIASGDLTNAPLLDAAVATKKTVYLSTGLSTLEEIDWAVARVPQPQLHLMHCIGAYPSPDEQVNLAAITFLQKRYNCPVGYSDHSRGITAPIAAVAIGAKSIEKHFMPKDGVPVADHELSVGVALFREMVDEIRRVEKMRGTEEKIVQENEVYFQTALRRSLYTNVTIPAGAQIKKEWLIPLRPWHEDALSPMDIEQAVGRVAICDIPAGAIIMACDIQ